jgi:predicted nucleic acid-binding protein
MRVVIDTNIWVSGLFVISGDHHLLALGQYADIPIVTIRDFFAQTFPQELET